MWSQSNPEYPARLQIVTKPRDINQRVCSMLIGFRTTMLSPHFLATGLDLMVSIHRGKSCPRPALPIAQQEAVCTYQIKNNGGKARTKSTSFVWVPCLVSDFCKIDESGLKASADRQTDLYLLLSI